ncbi:MAG: DegV family protein [Candidatus Izemoplasmatales bacterium]|nr:DegV family protein [Candidatus Izemoplasmatales bacterium]MDD5293070.1 DegV family protein [Candidatus Izemoplasmatales bacterium]
MSDYRIVTDSCIDLTDQLAKEIDVDVIPLTVMVKDHIYTNYLDEREISFKDFYHLLRQKHVPTTSQLNPEHFKAVWEPLLEAGQDILNISFSSALSGTYESSVKARDELKKQYPDRTIVVLDSLSASMGQGLLVFLAAAEKKSGKNLQEVAKWVEDNRLKVSHLFTVDDLNHLKRGGRLSFGRALLGSIINIKPLLHVDDQGRLVQTGMARGRRHALNKMVERMIETIENPWEQDIFISHGDCMVDVEYLKEQISKRINVKGFVTSYVGPVIGSHSGPGTLAFFYLGKDRT